VSDPPTPGGPAPPVLSLCWGTVMGTPLVDLIDVAAGAGFGGVAITPPMYREARAAGVSDAELRRRLDDGGVAVTVLDPLLVALPGSARPQEVGPRFRPLFEVSEDDCYRVADALGVARINVAHYLGHPTPVAELIDGFGAVCGRAAARGFDVLLEAMPDGGVPDLATSSAVVRGAGASNGSLMLDTWHHHRTGGTVAAVAALAPGELGGVQVSDAPAGLGGVGATGLLRRELPGDGVMPLAAMLAAALAGARDPFVGVEVFNDDLAALPVQEAAARAAAGLRAVLPVTLRGPGAGRGTGGGPRRTPPRAS
jgi:sugar phosphate isomerase/epimerase